MKHEIKQEFIMLLKIRTKEGEEIDFILQVSNQKWVAFDAKWSLNAKPVALPSSLSKELPSITEIVLVVPDGEEKQLSRECRQISVKNLFSFLSRC